MNCSATSNLILSPAACPPTEDWQLWFRAYYDINGGKRGQIMDFVHSDFETVLQRFCAKAGVEYQMNHNEKDRFKINGQWRDIRWIISNSKETLDFFDRKLGL